MLQTILFCAIFALSHNVLEKENIKISYVISSVIIGGIYLMAENYRIDNTLSHIIHPGVQIFKSVVYLLGISFTVFLFFCIIDNSIFVQARNENTRGWTNVFLKYSWYL